MERNDWEESLFTKKIRITEEDLEYIRKLKGKWSLARKLQEIINKERLANAKQSLSKEYGNARFC